MPLKIPNSVFAERERWQREGSCRVLGSAIFQDALEDVHARWHPTTFRFAQIPPSGQKRI